MAIERKDSSRSPEQEKTGRLTADDRAGGQWEWCGAAVLAGLAVYFLRVSWRKWPDPLIDAGPQWYTAWRISQGGRLFELEGWNYGPLSVYLNGLLFKIFGASLTVLFGANLLVYAAILVLAYFAFRRAWGRLGAFAACAVFISVFSFSHLTSVGNYTYAAPYSHESTHGMLLLFLTIFAVTRWVQTPSRGAAFAVGTCGGLAAVLKPEFMLATGVLGLAALVLRFLRRRPISGRETALLAAGTVWPTLAFTLFFSIHESMGEALAHAGNAWWLVLVQPLHSGVFTSGLEQMSGFDHPWTNAWMELREGLCGIAVLSAIGVAGWLANRSLSAARLMMIAALGALAWYARPDGGWFRAGRCLPLLMLAALIVAGRRLWKQWRLNGELETGAILRVMLVLAAGAMMARMALFARIYHFGFFQAALAGMVAGAVIVAEIPRWAGTGRAGIILARTAGMVLLAWGCISIAERSNAIRAEQTQPVGSGGDRFYVFNRSVDTTGTLVDWVSRRLALEPPGTLLVLPSGLSINYLTRRAAPFAGLGRVSEEMSVTLVRSSPPDYVVFISQNFAERGLPHYGQPGHVGYLLVQWVNENYETVAVWGEPFSDTGLKGARILRRKTGQKLNPSG